MFTVKSRQKDKSAKCRFFVVLGGGPALLGVPNIKLLNTQRITCEGISNPYESRKLDSLTTEVSNSPSWRTHRSPWNKTKQVHMMIIQTCNVSSGQAQTKQQIKEQVRYLQIKHKEFSNVFSGRGCFEGTFSLQVKDGSWPYEAPP